LDGSAVELKPKREILTAKCFMILRSPRKHENEDLVMPAWMAGIQDGRMRPETSMSAWIPALHDWNDAIEGFYLN
jgi:hypothetical protein